MVRPIDTIVDPHLIIDGAGCDDSFHSDINTPATANLIVVVTIC